MRSELVVIGFMARTLAFGSRRGFWLGFELLAFQHSLIALARGT